MDFFILLDVTVNNRSMQTTLLLHHSHKPVLHYKSTDNGRQPRNILLNYIELPHGYEKEF